MKKSILAGLLIAATLVLAACSEGDTRSGYGDNASSQLPDFISAIEPTTGDVLKHCADLGYSYVKKLIGCSQQSYLECKCYSPVDPAQNPK